MEPRRIYGAVNRPYNHPRTHMREVQETSETLDVGALAGVAIEASARSLGLWTAQRGSPAGSVPWGETNFEKHGLRGM